MSWSIPLCLFSECFISTRECTPRLLVTRFDRTRIMLHYSCEVLKRHSVECQSVAPNDLKIPYFTLSLAWPLKKTSYFTSLILVLEHLCKNMKFDKQLAVFIKRFVDCTGVMDPTKYFSCLPISSLCCSDE